MAVQDPSLGAASTLVVLAGLLAALSAAEQTSSISGFPCRAGQWLPSNWTALSSHWSCQDCYVCARGEECLQRGGCVPCEHGHVDHDTNPTTRCEPCAAGTVPSVDKLTCIDDDESLLELADEATNTIAAVTGSALVVVAACCGNAAAEQGLRGLAHLLCCCCCRAKEPDQQVTQVDADEESGTTTTSVDHANGGSTVSYNSSDSLLLEPRFLQQDGDGDGDDGEEETRGLLSSGAGGCRPYRAAPDLFTTPRDRPADGQGQSQGRKQGFGGAISSAAAAAAVACTRVSLSPRKPALVESDAADHETVVLRRRDFTGSGVNGASPRHRRQRSIDSTGDYFSPSAAFTDSNGTQSSSPLPSDEPDDADDFLSTVGSNGTVGSAAGSPRLEPTSPRHGLSHHHCGGATDYYNLHDGANMERAGPLEDPRAVAKRKRQHRRNSAVWTPSPSLARVRTV